MRYFLYIAYLGKSYSGWQTQQNACSVQEVIEQVLSRLLATKTRIHGSSRTDKGVHAQQQVAHFDAIKPIDDVENLIYRLNRMLPIDISITAIRPVQDDAHARFDACYRIYEYAIVYHKNPFYAATTVWFYRLPPLPLLNQIAALFCVQTDFEFFSKVSPQVMTSVCTIKEAIWIDLGNSIIFRIKADRFLRGMVRIIVATILKVGYGTMSVETLSNWIRTKPAQRPLLTLVPSHGLTLTEIGYPERLFVEK
ncbi:tRNA pseudouridine(38-40) synthase TruA [Candidatus Cardinium hertigii]|uniref:tRNA pseudouridine synthase A n=1 Tax=Candidatus Cardinium hertigii TaxID=247481 RepID=A0A2Z3L9Q4_9BACT|nr:tRNA pseudouridine(38-40) synthase TruA [Candidatus Cardinium hertigii]AWN82087.1 tRNA pseudouridine synthase A [Candidatus Cardinium hertigii]